MYNLAPVILFTYNRLDHTKLTIESLKRNALSQDTDLFIFSDAAKKQEDYIKVNQVREYLSTITGFKSINIIKQESNMGLADSIINGVTEIISKFNKAIILEDDIITSPIFLDFMNHALDKYKKSKDVWHVAGWNYPIPPENLPESFFWETMSCWGWATWKDRWDNFKKDPRYLIDNWDRKKIKKFNIDGASDYWSQIVNNENGKLNTWAIFWYATIFEHNGLCLSPTISLCKNIGFDGSGTNCDNVNIFQDVRYIQKNKIPRFPIKIEINYDAKKRIVDFYKKNKVSIFKRIINKTRKIFGTFK